MSDNQVNTGTQVPHTFQADGYTLVKGLVDTGWFYQYAYLLKGKGTLREDRQVPGSHIATGDPMFGKLLTSLLPAIEQHTGYKLYETYAFFRLYELGQELKRHTDRYECEVTVSLCLGYKGESWPIFIEDKDGREHSFVQEAGDAVIFKGIELPHWRAPNTYGECAYLFLHYVVQDGPFSEHRKGGSIWPDK